MTTRPKASELHPTAELRDWNYIDGRRYIHGSFWNCVDWEDGAIGTVTNIIDIRYYKDHIIAVTQNGCYFKAYYAERHFNGGSK